MSRLKIMVLVLALLGFGAALAAEQGDKPRAQFQRVFELLRTQALDDGLTESDLYLGAIEGMLKAAASKDVRKYNTVLDGERYREIRIATSGKLAGIGAALTLGGNGGVRLVSQHTPLVVVRVFEGAPAHRAGLQTGDAILRIDDQDTAGMTMMQAISLLRGKPGTRVRLLTLRGSQTRPISVTRATVEVPSVRTHVYPGKIGYLTIRAFTRQSGEQARRAFASLKKQSIRGLILDLRGNGGGALDGVLEVARQLVPANKTITTLVERKDRTVHAGEKRMFGDIPVVVLVDQRTASGAEMLTRALQENGLGLVVGEQTFGKNSLETIEEIGPKTAIKYTVARWQSPQNKNPGGEGLVPDIPVQASALPPGVPPGQDMDARLQQDAPLKVAYHTIRFKLQ